jgi:selT/selW/selH-like putative selenoprotein
LSFRDHRIIDPVQYIMQIQIQHCQSSDFLSQARALKEFLSSHYPNADITLANGKTDSFEVVVNDVVAHSNIGAGPNVRATGEKFPSHAALLAVVKQVNDAAPGYQPPSLKKGPEELKTYMTVTIQYCGG